MSLTTPEIAPDLPGWISIPAHCLHEAGVLRLRESPDADRRRLAHQLADGIYPRPYILDDGKTRRLYFNAKLIQSEMEIARPDVLSAVYTQRMMGFLLFNALPKHVLIVGLGGGSLAKYCYRQLGRTRITALELDAFVIASRDWFCVPPDDARLRVLQADAADYFAQPGEGADAILLDAYDEDGLAPQLCSEAFYTNLRAHLKPSGVLVANISGHGPTADTHLALIAEVFHARCVVLDVMSEGNRIVYAFNNPAHPPAWGTLARGARQLDERLDLDFVGMLRDMERSAQRQKRRGRR